MRPLENQNYYEILEIPYNVSYGEIQRAYELARLTYAKNSLAVNPLFDAADLDHIREKIDEAYHTLTDSRKKEEYDKTIKNIIGEIQPRHVKPSTPSQRGLPEPYLSHQELSGKDLKKLREEAGITLPEIAERTRISIAHLLHLEEDRLGSLPPETYLRSYLNQYAVALGFDGKQFTERYLVYFRRQRNTPTL